MNKHLLARGGDSLLKLHGRFHPILFNFCDPLLLFEENMNKLLPYAIRRVYAAEYNHA
jgi:hypothetical protein